MRATILGNVLPLNYGWIKFHFTLLFHKALLHDFIIFPWDKIPHSDYHGSNELKNYTEQELLHYLG